MYIYFFCIDDSAMNPHFEAHLMLLDKDKTFQTRTVRKSDYTPALALPKHMAGIFEKCREKEKYREEQIGECPFSIPRHNLSL